MHSAWSRPRPLPPPYPPLLPPPPSPIRTYSPPSFSSAIHRPEHFSACTWAAAGGSRLSGRGSGGSGGPSWGRVFPRGCKNDFLTPDNRSSPRGLTLLGARAMATMIESGAIDEELSQLVAPGTPRRRGRPQTPPGPIDLRGGREGGCGEQGLIFLRLKLLGPSPAPGLLFLSWRALG